MPTPEQVNPRNFQVERVLFSSDGFSIAWGKGEDGESHLAMRWDGEGESPGYPKLFGNPVWFFVTEELAFPIVRALLGAPGAREEEILSAIPSLPRTS